MLWCAWVVHCAVKLFQHQKVGLVYVRRYVSLVVNKLLDHHVIKRTTVLITQNRLIVTRFLRYKITNQDNARQLSLFKKFKSCVRSGGFGERSGRAKIFKKQKWCLRRAVITLPFPRPRVRHYWRDYGGGGVGGLGPPKNWWGVHIPAKNIL